MRVKTVQAIFSILRDLEPVVLDISAFLEKGEHSELEKLADNILKLVKKYGIDMPIPDFVLKWLICELTERLFISLDKLRGACYNPN
ncbi:MAG: hypothetical protein J7M13_02480 [Synergistetes bacterium]|nr:hypothetical protein [Synergistota bacterium]